MPAESEVYCRSGLIAVASNRNACFSYVAVSIDCAQLITILSNPTTVKNPIMKT
ncbi:hypothetical protein HNQ94_003736 [Salirhabdus euzebyi]|uniref:Uncharacterized protein n=1 Tax=Salirhabdus euzebyi TaxID=394506 RepID=A0A841Q989_9BACI|nr:hypothetical protein [Salirhabdus euzebyi]MBB6455239.1 hypothetical protein [Salirhabdus euzebyi]